MANQRDAREWARESLRGIGDSLYTPFCGPDGDDVDWDAYRVLVRYCIGELGHPMLWLTSGLAEFWSLTMDERKRLLEVAVEEARAINPDTVIQACTTATSAKDCLELTRHAQEAGADIAYIQTPSMEVHGGEGVRRFFEYVAERTDIALGIFNSPSSGYVLTPAEVVELYEAVPAICAMKEGNLEPWRSRQIAAGAPDLLLWECNPLALTAGWAASGMICKAALGTVGYFYDFPGNPRGTEWHELLWSGKIDEAIKFAADTREFDIAHAAIGKWLTCYPDRADYFTHWGEPAKYGAELIGLPVGDYRRSRPPQGVLPERAKEEIRSALEGAGLIGVAGQAVARLSRTEAQAA